MTKVRPPLTIDAALARIAGVVPGGWKEMARLVGRSDSTVRAWGDESLPEQMLFPAAIKLDIAFQRAGGVGTPLLDVYALLLDEAKEDAFPDQIDNARSACVVAREGGDAVAALITASLPGATPADEEVAIKELEDLVSAAKDPLTRLAAKRGRRAHPP